MGTAWNRCQPAPSSRINPQFHGTVHQRKLEPGYLGALYHNRQLTCCFCSCNLFLVFATSWHLEWHVQQILTWRCVVVKLMECPKQLETERLGILCFPAKDLVNLVTWATHSSVSAPWHRGTVREALNCKDAFNSGLSSTRTCWELQPGTWRSEPGTLLHVAGPRGFAAATWAQLLEFRIWAFWHTPFWEIAGYLLVSTFRQLMSVPHFQLQVYTLISPDFHVSARFFLLIMQFSCWPTPWKGQRCSQDSWLPGLAWMGPVRIQLHRKCSGNCDFIQWIRPVSRNLPFIILIILVWISPLSSHVQHKVWPSKAVLEACSTCKGKVMNSGCPRFFWFKTCIGLLLVSTNK